MRQPGYGSAAACRRVAGVWQDCKQRALLLLLPLLGSGTRHSCGMRAQLHLPESVVNRLLSADSRICCCGYCMRCASAACCMREQCGRAIKSHWHLQRVWTCIVRLLSSNLKDITSLKAAQCQASLRGGPCCCFSAPQHPASHAHRRHIKAIIRRVALGAWRALQTAEGLAASVGRSSSNSGPRRPLGPARWLWASTWAQPTPPSP